jgi:hypothetical protein
MALLLVYGLCAQTEKRESTSVSNARRFSKDNCFLEGSQALLIGRSGKTNMYMKMSVENWWNDTDRGKWSISKAVTLELVLSKYTEQYFFFRKSFRYEENCTILYQ